jgi:hypothetical protein
MTFKAFQGVREGTVDILAVFDARTNNTDMRGSRALGYTEELDAASIRDEVLHLETVLKDAFSHEADGLKGQIEQYGRALDAIDTAQRRSRFYFK